MGGGDFIEHRLDRDPALAALQEADRRLVREIVLGVIRRRAALDWLAARRCRTGLPTGPVADLLRVGLYQIVFLDRVPPHAAVNETVAAAHALGLGSRAGFVNAVLRASLRDGTGLRMELAQLAETDPATAHSHPAWLVDRWRRRWSSTDVTRLLEANNTSPETFARVNTLRTDPASLASRWVTEGVEAEPWSADWTEGTPVFRLRHHPALASLPSFLAGGFYVQDPSTLLAVQRLDPRPGERILDLCAAPGGKTTLIAQRMGNTGVLVAEDSHPERLRLLRENCIRLGVTCIPEAGPDGHAPVDPADFDGVLVDAPCSNTGVLRRRVEARWRLTPETLASLASLQSSLLDRAAERVRPGGRLVYSTCSLEPDENTDRVTSFLERHPAFHLESERLLVPFETGVDGAYAAVLIRNGPTPGEVETEPVQPPADR